MRTATAVGLAAFAGVLVATQAAALGAAASRELHPVTAAFWVQLLGLGTAAAVVLIAPVPWTLPGGAAPWAALAGACTVGIVASIGLAVGPLGVASVVATVTGAQLLVAFAFDVAGVGGPAVAVSGRRLAGAALIVLGVWLVLDRAPGSGPGT